MAIGVKGNAIYVAQAPIPAQPGAQPGRIEANGKRRFPARSVLPDQRAA
jgi:hypothetical protein